MTGRTPSTTADDLVKVAYASDESEAELLQGLLRTADVTSVVRRGRGFDAPEFGAAGPRDVLVAASDVPLARGILREVTLVSPSHRRPPAKTGPRGCSQGCWSPVQSSGSWSASPLT